MKAGENPHPGRALSTFLQAVLRIVLRTFLGGIWVLYGTVSPEKQAKTGKGQKSALQHVGVRQNRELPKLWLCIFFSLIQCKKWFPPKAGSNVLMPICRDSWPLCNILRRDHGRKPFLSNDPQAHTHSPPPAHVYACLPVCSGKSPALSWLKAKLKGKATFLGPPLPPVLRIPIWKCFVQGAEANLKPTDPIFGNPAAARYERIIHLTFVQTYSADQPNGRLPSPKKSLPREDHFGVPDKKAGLCVRSFGRDCWRSKRQCPGYEEHRHPEEQLSQEDNKRDTIKLAPGHPATPTFGMAGCDTRHWTCF